jgi:hypothetical protein
VSLLKRLFLIVVVFAGVCISAAVGFWFGFREALPLGVKIDRLPQGAIAVQQLNALRVGNTQNLATALEFNVDEGLVWSYDVFNHPLRGFLGPLWGLNLPDYEKYATRLADYRKQHRSPMPTEPVEHKPLDNPEDEAQFQALMRYGTELHHFKLQAMIERYATKQ